MCDQEKKYKLGKEKLKDVEWKVFTPPTHLH